MNTDRLFGIHVNTVQVRAERASILARNMANADTPGYKARDIEFRDLLSSQHDSAPTLQTTRDTHIKPDQGSLSRGQLKYRIPQQAAADGNTVDMQTERAEFMRNALMYQTSMQFLNGRIKGLMTAIRGE